MSIYISLLIAGFGGGLVRGLVGFLKNQYSYKNTGFNLPYFFGMMFLSGVIGVLTAVAVKYSFISLEGVEYVSPSIAFIVGYAGGDFLEGIYKIFLKKEK
ncbi:MAG: hypothetical protein WA091_01360 [Minisyncoccales bacterium]